MMLPVLPIADFSEAFLRLATELEGALLLSNVN